MAFRKRTILGALSLAIALAGTSLAHADITGEWLTSGGRLVFEARGDGRYHATYSAAAIPPGQVPIELQGSLKDRVFEGHWISHWVSRSGSKDCGVEMNGSPFWGWVRLEFDERTRRYFGLEGRCEEVRPTGLWLGRRALTGDESGLQDYAAAVRSSLEAFPTVLDGRCRESERFGLVIHGGAHSSRGNNDDSRALIKQILLRSEVLLRTGASALDIVEWSVRTLEDSGLFGAGRGATANQAGVVELDASIMAGAEREAGAVAAVTRTKNPITGARLVMERSPHVLMVGPGADRFIADKGGETVEQDYFHGATKDFRSLVLPADLEIVPPSPALAEAQAVYSGLWTGRWYGYRDIALVVESIGSASAEIVYAVGAAPDWGQIFPWWWRGTARRADDGLAFDIPGNSGLHFTLEVVNRDTMGLSYRNNLGRHGETSLSRWTKEALPGQHGTVGAVALDRCGDLAAGTSTAGYGSKPPGRVGDSPIIGAGTYADNSTAAISATGHGEYFIRFAAAHDIAAMMEYAGASLQEAADHVIKKKLFARGLSGGVIAIDREGNIAMPYNTEFMLRGAVSNNRPASVAYD